MREPQLAASPGATAGGSVDGPWRFGSTEVVCHPVVTGEAATTLAELYRAAFEPLRRTAAARQVLTDAELTAELEDPRVWKYVAYDDHGRAVGLSTLTADLATVPWASPEYFAERYPEAWRRNALMYLGFTLAEPGQRSQRIFHSMLRCIVVRLVEARAVCAYDICGFNDSSFAFGSGIERLLRRMAAVEVEPVDVQTYYPATFGGADPARTVVE